MMLYVFHVDAGRMMKFDMNVALSSVENLKDVIQRLHGIPAANIVLLVSGGEMLTQATQVAYYSAGTDTNPIYMFQTGDCSYSQPIPQIEANSDLREQVERSLELPPVYETVNTRAQLALRMYDVAREHERLYESLVHEQHLQQQGWSAVIANMEDLTHEFRGRFDKFCTYFDRHLANRPHYVEMLSNFSGDLTKLECIPILPGLMQTAQQDFHGFDELLEPTTDAVFSRPSTQQQSVVEKISAVDNESAAASGDNGEHTNAEVATGMGAMESSGGDDKSSSSTSPNKKQKMGTGTTEEEQQQQRQEQKQEGGAANSSETSTTSSTARRRLNLLQWITSKENQNTLKMMSDECSQSLGTFTNEIYEKLKAEFQNIIKISEKNDMREIKGLGDRLCRLDEFKYRIKGMVNDLKVNSSAFQNNLTRANNLRDPSVLPDLCTSHQSQLMLMLQYHSKVRDLGRCIIKAKLELGNNVTARLKHIVRLENTMSEFDNRLLFYHRCIQRAQRHIHIIEQIHQAPCIYVAAVTEVVRRRLFSGEFRIWATKLAEDFESIHNEEIKRRQEFNASFTGHFLNILFPGMGDMPPAFANEVPLIFDARLPNITRSDIDMLSSQLPDLASYIELPDMGHVIKFFVSRSGDHQMKRLEELVLKQQAASSSDRPLQHQRIIDLQKKVSVGGAGSVVGCEDSETDTETEFEKLPVSAVQTVATSTSENQDPETMARSTTTDVLLMQSAETLTEENESTARGELECLRKVLNEMSRLSMDCIRMARTNLDSFRTDTVTYRDDLQSKLQMLNEKCSLLRMECEASQQNVEAASAEQNSQLQQMCESLHRRVEEVEKLRDEQTTAMDAMQSKCTKLESEVQMLQTQLEEERHATEKAVVETRQALIHEHKTEIESLRCRFKLMTSMEQRSPSDTSLEKIERPLSAADIADNMMIDVAQHDAMLAQLRSDLEAEKEKAINAAVEAERLRIMSINSESVMANVSILKEMLEEKERQLELLREKDLMVTKENFQLKTRLDALTNDEGSSWLKDKIDYLNRDKCRLESELKSEKVRCQEMERSFALLRSSVHEQQQQSVLQRSRSSGSSSHRSCAVLESCAQGDIVFVIWSVRHSQFLIVQESSSLHFLHGDSLEALNLHVPPTIGFDPYYTIGRVVDKEYCQAKKDENRYHVTRGSKFYRIKLAPLIPRPSTRRERLESFSSSISRSISQCESHSESSTAALQPAVPSTTSIIAADFDTLRQSQSVNAAMCAEIKDVVDVGTTTGTALAAAANATTVITPLTGELDERVFKERTISETSVAIEDDEPISFLAEPCRYISVSEEDETTALVAAATAATDGLMITTTTTTTITTTTTTLQQSVITEQPTASSTFQLNLMLASADIIPSPLQQQEQQQQQLQQSTLTAATTLPDQQATQENAAAGPVVTVAINVLPPASDGVDITSPAIPIPIGTASEDSDEYRSLEAKDDLDFTIPE